MSYTSYWKGTPGKSQKPPKKEPSSGIHTPRSDVDAQWVLTDGDGGAPPTYPEVNPQAGPARLESSLEFPRKGGVSGPARTPERSSSRATTHRPTDADLPEVAIAIMGATGTGKSTFINLISGSNLGVNKGLRSCTNTVQVAGAFDVDGRRVVLIDTPGFDDTTRSDTDVLKMIAAFLATSYERGSKLAGVLYFHRISDFRMGGISTRNFNMFRKLCGDNTLQNVVIVTNMWGEVDPQVGNDREAELMSEGIFFKPVLDKGARMARHQNTVPSAEDIVRLILDNHPLPLRIQEELVDERKDISETGAGEELNREIKAQIERHQEEIRVLREEMERAIREKDEETRKELEIEMRRMQREVERFRNDARRLESDYTKEKGMLESRLEEMESEGRQEADRIAARYQQQIDELRTALRSNAETSEREKALLLQQIDELSRRSARAQAAGPAGVGVLSMIGAILDQLLLPAMQRFLPRPSR